LTVQYLNLRYEYNDNNFNYCICYQNMSNEDQEEEKPFVIERAKTARAKCKKCKYPIDKDELRIAKFMPNPFGDGKTKCWHHINCIFEVFAKQRASTKRIENPECDISGWDLLCNEDKAILMIKLDVLNATGMFCFSGKKYFFGFTNFIN
jgi:hypothetical protein